MSRRDPNTSDMFGPPPRDMYTVPTPPAPLPGSMDYRTVVCGLVKSMLKGHDRIDVAASMSKLTGRDVTGYMLDSYCANSRDDYNLPAYLVPALEVATTTHEFSNWLAATRGGRLLIGRDALAAELGRIQRQKEDLMAAEKALRTQLRRGS